MLCVSRGRTRRDERLAKEFSKRLKELIGDMSLPKVSERLGGIVSPVTLWDYINGHSLPRPDVLLKIAELFDVTVDYLLTGQQPLFPANKLEKKFFDTMREAEALGIAEQAEQFVRLMIEQKKKTEGNPPLEGKASTHN